MIGIDHIKELVDDSITNVKKDDPSLITSGRIKLIGKSEKQQSKMDFFQIQFGDLYYWVMKRYCTKYTVQI